MTVKQSPAIRLCAGLLLCLIAAPAAYADDSMIDLPAVDQGKLLATSGVSQIEGASGGGLVPWSTIAGYGTRDAVGFNIHETYVRTGDYSLNAPGLAIGLYDRVELSYASDLFDTGSTGGKLGIGNGYTFRTDVFGAKLKLVGDLVYDQDTLLPQIAIGLQYKDNHNRPLVRALGARDSAGLDYYVSATKLFLAQSLLVDATLRMTRANQFGLLGFGGDRNNDYQPEFEGSAALLLSKKLAVGAEYRTKPNNLGFAKEQSAFDVFAAYFITKNVSATLAYVDLGSIATFKNQRGVYASLQLGF
jgi:hypothetical protein